MCFLNRSLLALCITSTLVLATTSAKTKAPNILFIAADDLRPDLGAYGNTQVKTPHLDALARRGMVFSRAYCQQAVCNPSRASLLTGLRPDQIRVWDLAARFRATTPDVVTLPQYFKEHGYTTIGIGKIFHNEPTGVAASHPMPMADPQSWSRPPTHATGAHWQDWVVPGDPRGPQKKDAAFQCLDVPDDAYFDGQIATETCETLRQLKRQDQPFFLAVGFWKPHLPFNAPKRYWDLYHREDISSPRPEAMPKEAPEIARHRWSELRGYTGIPKEGPLSEELTAELRHGYLASISFLDAQVGRVLQELKTQGLEENTVVLFWGDHGFHLGEHALWGKTSNYEFDTRVPLIIAAPLLQQSSGKTEAVTELVDVYPTLLELAGLPPRQGLAGQSLVPVMQNPSLPGKPYAVTQHPHPFYGAKSTHMAYSLRTPRFRYVEWRELSGGAVTAQELYDHEADPSETKNVVAEPAYRDALLTLAKSAAGVVEQSGRWSR